MTTHYDDKILENTSEWITTNDLARSVKGDKTGIIQSAKNLESIGYLESKKVGNTTQYKRNDIADSEINFNYMIKTIETNQQVELDEIKKMSYHITSKKGKLTKRGKDLLDHIQSEVDRMYMVIVRMSYQDKLDLIPHQTAEKRIKTIQTLIDKIMSKLLKFDNQTVIKEYFQNHSKELKFKI